MCTSCAVLNLSFPVPWSKDPSTSMNFIPQLPLWYEDLQITFVLMGVALLTVL